MVGRLLHILASASKAKHVLEIGTAIGYSAIWFGLAVKRNKGKVVTIEIDSGVAKEAMKNIRRAGLAKTIEVIIGDSLQVIPKLKGKFDIIFIDDTKENYPKYLDPCIKRLNKNGLLIADNALWKGEVTYQNKSEDADAIARFNELLMKRMRSVIIPARDGVAIGIK
jgi:predicted O-methyltransferase YrrM